MTRAAAVVLALGGVVVLGLALAVRVLVQAAAVVIEIGSHATP